jgi:copper transport protein
VTLVKERPQRTKSNGWKEIKPRHLVALLLLVATCWVVLIATTPPQSGEPVLRSTSPGNAETVKSPDQVQLSFDRPVPSGLVTVRIIDPNGDQIIFERPVHPNGRADTVSVPMPPQRYEGTYAVAWTMPSSRLEPIGGMFTFDVNSAIAPLGLPDIETTHDASVAAIQTAFRFAAVAALVLLVGAAFFVAAIWPAGAHSRGVRRLVTGSWCGLVVATLGVFASFGPYAAWAPLSSAFDPRLLSGTFESDAGGELLTRLYVLIPATLGLAQLMTAPPAETTRERWLRGGTVLGCAAAVAATWSLSHTRAPLPLAVDIALLTTIAVAAGGLVLLWFRGGKQDTVVPRFSRTAMVCAGLLVATGGYLALQHGVANSSYGWLLAGLLALVVLLLATGLLLRRWHRAHEGAKKSGPALLRLRRLAVVATGVTGVILAATALLVVIRPPQTAHAQEPASPLPAIRNQEGPARLPFDTGNPSGQGQLDLVLIPSTDAQDRVHLDVHVTTLNAQDTTKDDVKVTAVLDPPDHAAAKVPVSLTAAAPGYSTGQATIPSRGQWELALTVRAADGSQQTVAQPIDVS